jgi:hypothetical protein
LAELLRYEAERYDGRRNDHFQFVRSSWCWGARKGWETLAARLRRPDTGCLVAHCLSDPDQLQGWAAVDGEGAVIWSYVRDLSAVRRHGLMTSLLLDLGVDVSRPTPCLFWSPDAATIAARDGYRIFYAPKGARREAA